MCASPSLSDVWIQNFLKCLIQTQQMFPSCSALTLEGNEWQLDFGGKEKQERLPLPENLFFSQLRLWPKATGMSHSSVLACTGRLCLGETGTVLDCITPGFNSALPSHANRIFMCTLRLLCLLFNHGSLFQAVWRDVC